MPVQKEKKYEITFKNLRRREIPCLVVAVPQKTKDSTYSDTQSGFRTCNIQDIASAKILKRLKQRLSHTSKTPKKKSKSLSYLDSKSELSFKVAKKTVGRRKSSKIETTPQKKSCDIPDPTSDVSGNTSVVAAEAGKEKTFDVPDTTSNISENAAVVAEEPPKKRTYRKKTIKVATITKITGSPVSTSTVELSFGTPVITPETPKKRVYRKKLKIPAVPHNTPVLCPGSDGDSITSASFFSQSTGNGGKGDVITVIKRGRGRPRLSMPPFRLGSDNGEESTMSQGSDKSSTARRVRRSLWAFDYDDEEQDEGQVSEYELLRQRNIEENLKKLREIFTEQGLQFEEKASETPKKRKSYSRVPLPPPRPRSQRIEIRRTFMPLDFSGLDEKLTMSEAAFM